MNDSEALRSAYRRLMSRLVGALTALMMMAPSLRGQELGMSAAGAELAIDTWIARSMVEPSLYANPGELQRVLAWPDSFPESTVRAVLDGMQRVIRAEALGMLRLSAARMLGASVRLGTSPYRADMLKRVIATYEAVPDTAIRQALVIWLHGAKNQDGLVQFSEAVAADSGTTDWTRSRALDILALNGDSGRAALSRLHRQGSVPHGSARRYLDLLATSQFRRCFGESPGHGIRLRWVPC